MQSMYPTSYSDTSIVPEKRPYIFFMTVNFLLTMLYILWALTPYLTRNLPQLYLGVIISGWLVSALFIALTNKNAIKKRIH